MEYGIAVRIVDLVIVNTHILLNSCKYSSSICIPFESLALLFNVKETVSTNGAARFKVTIDSCWSPETRVHFPSVLALACRRTMVMCDLALFRQIYLTVSTNFGAWLVVLNISLRRISSNRVGRVILCVYFIPLLTLARR